MIIAIILCVLSFVLPRVIGFDQTGNNIFSYSIIGVLIALFIAMIVTNSITKKKITQENIKSRQKVMEIFGEENFNSLIDKQKDYMDEYFKNLYPAEEEIDGEEKTEDALDAPAEEATEDKEESKEIAEVKEESEEVAEEKAEEVKEEASDAATEEKISE